MLEKYIIEYLDKHYEFISLSLNKISIIYAKETDKAISSNDIRNDLVAIFSIENDTALNIVEKWIVRGIEAMETYDSKNKKLEINLVGDYTKCPECKQVCTMYPSYGGVSHVGSEPITSGNSDGDYYCKDCNILIHYSISWEKVNYDIEANMFHGSRD